MSTEAHQEGRNAQDPFSWAYGSLDIQREVPVWHTVPLRIIDVHRRGRWKPQVIDSGPSTKSSAAGLRKNFVYPSASSDVCSGLNSYVGSYYLSVMMSQGYPIGTPIFQPSVGTSCSSSSGVSPDRGSIEDYSEIWGSVCWNPALESHRISMVGPAMAHSHNSSSRYPTIRGSEASDARTPSNRIVRNLNPSFNVVWIQTTMESIQRMVPHDSPLVALA
jgi:hypothetical protein